MHSLHLFLLQIGGNSNHNFMNNSRYAGDTSMTPSPSSEYDEEDLGFSSGGGGAPSLHRMPQSTMNKFSGGGYNHANVLSGAAAGGVGGLPSGTISHQRAMVHHTPPASSKLIPSSANGGGGVGGGVGGMKMLSGGGKEGAFMLSKNGGRPGVEQYHQHHQHNHQHQFQSVSASSAESLPSASGSSTKALVHSPNRFSDSSGCGGGGVSAMNKEVRKFADALVPNGKTLKECILDSLDNDAANFKAVEIINQQRPFR